MTDKLITLIINARNLTAPQLKGLQKDLKGVDDAGARTAAVLGRAGKVAGGVLTLGLGAAAGGSMELTRIQGELQAETGASAEEADQLTGAINAIAGDTRTSLSTVAAAMSKVKTDLGATGDEAEALTRVIVDFARVNREDAAASVASLDDILDNWGKTTADARGILDQLTVSHQRYGGEVGANMRTLAALAPALRAANYEVDDGIALLGLFGAKGLDAEQGSAAFAKALTKVKSPAELQALIDDISSTDDAFVRAQKAADLFGARAGAKLANALGGANLDDYRVSVGEAAGAVKNGAKVIDDSASIIDKALAKGSAAVRGFGDTFGTALMGASALASLTSNVASVLGVSIGPALIAGFAKAGLTGVAIAGGGLALPLTIVAGITLAGLTDDLPGGMGSAPGWAQSAWDKVLGKDTGPSVIAVQPTLEADGLTEQYRAMLGTLSEEQRRSAPNFQEWATAQRAAIAAAAPDAAGTARASGRAVADAYEEGLDGGYGESDARADGAALGATFGAAQAEALWRSRGEAVAAEQGVIAGVKAAIASGASSLASAWRAALDDRNREANARDQILVNNAEIAAQKKILASAKATAAEKAQARITLRNLRADNNALWTEIAAHGSRTEQIAGLKSRLTSETMRKGLGSKDPEIRAKWIALHSDLRKQIENLERDAGGYGKGIGQGLADGLKAKIPTVGLAGAGLAAAVFENLHTNSPAEKGPLSKDGGPDGWGRIFGRLFGDGIGDSVGGVTARARRLASAAIPRLPDLGALAASPLAGAGFGALAMAGAGAFQTNRGLSRDEWRGPAAVRAAPRSELGPLRAKAGRVGDPPGRGQAGRDAAVAADSVDGT